MISKEFYEEAKNEIMELWHKEKHENTYKL
jgi:hypothetical protein